MRESCQHRHVYWKHCLKLIKIDFRRMNSIFAFTQSIFFLPSIVAAKMQFLMTFMCECARGGNFLITIKNFSCFTNCFGNSAKLENFQLQLSKVFCVKPTMKMNFSFEAKFSSLIWLFTTSGFLHTIRDGFITFINFCVMSDIFQFQFYHPSRHK